ncbi:MAG: pyridoxal 5'-phosphate synthase glutaminase subunit PdxT [Calditrichaeota bacterium]|nr:pyridoxal 5'-phosphate synthase glutaminase subunit PdxT [Calditrichota bacterium]
MARVGVLALQGDFPKHEDRLRALGCEVMQVRMPEDLNGLEALVWPGGESTTMTRVMSDELRVALTEFCVHHPVWGTCAGMIMLAHTDPDPRVRTLGLADVHVNRNGWGRQVHSFEGELSVVPELESPTQATGIFIRAPRITRIGKHIRVLATIRGEPVAVSQDRMLLTTFHPELTGDDRFHRLLLSWILEPQRSRISSTGDRT